MIKTKSDLLTGRKNAIFASTAAKATGLYRAYKKRNKQAEPKICPGCGKELGGKE